MSFEIKGRYHADLGEKIVNEKFRKREFVLELNRTVNGIVYYNYAKMQLVRHKTILIEPFQIDDILVCRFNIRASKREAVDGSNGYINNLCVWHIEKVEEGEKTI